MSRCICLALSLFVALGCGQAAAGSASAPEDPAPSEPEPGQAAKRPPCTLGADQTCNADPSVSALWGRCTELGVCECQPGFELNPLGRCQPAR